MFFPGEQEEHVTLVLPKIMKRKKEKNLITIFN